MIPSDGVQRPNQKAPGPKIDIQHTTDPKDEGDVDDSDEDDSDKEDDGKDEHNDSGFSFGTDDHGDSSDEPCSVVSELSEDFQETPRWN